MIAINRIRLIDCPATKSVAALIGSGVSTLWKNFLVIHLLITTKAYNPIRIFKEGSG